MVDHAWQPAALRRTATESVRFDVETARRDETRRRGAGVVVVANEEASDPSFLLQVQTQRRRR